jgi:hypothetical protein
VIPSRAITAFVPHTAEKNNGRPQSRKGDNQSRDKERVTHNIDKNVHMNFILMANQFTILLVSRLANHGFSHNDNQRRFRRAFGISTITFSDYLSRISKNGFTGLIFIDNHYINYRILSTISTPSSVVNL